MNKLFRSTAACLLCLLLWASCSKDSPTDSGPGNQSSMTFADVINSGGDFEPLVEDSVAGPVEYTVDTADNDEVYYCTRQTISLTDGNEQFALFDPNTEVVYPGNLLQGASLADPTPMPIVVPRGPGTIVMTVMNGADSLAPVARSLPAMTLGNVYNAANEIISGNPGTLAARTTFHMSRVSSEQELGIAIGASFNNLAGNIQGSFGYEHSVAYNRFLVTLEQSFYTIVYELPTTYDEVFAPSVTPADLDDYIGPGNPAAFISSVTYGRIFYLLIQSTESYDSLGVKIDASFKAGIGLSGDVNYVQSLQDLKIGGYAVGGEAGKAIGALQGGMTELKAFIDSGGTITTGAPLSYVVRSLRHRDRIVSVKINTEYEKIDCIPIGASLENPIFWFDAGHGVTRVGDDVSKWSNLLDETRPATPRIKTYGGTYLPNAVTGPNLPAIRFVPSETNDGMLGYDGQDFANSDYTVFAVARLPSVAISYPEYFMWGSGTTAGTNLRLGYNNWSNLLMSHIDPKCIAPGARTFDQFNLFTFVFSRDDGMSIYMNGQLMGSDASATQPLSQYLGARIGTKGGGAIDIAELEAFGIAVSDAQRQFVEGELLRKYGGL